MAGWFDEQIRNRKLNDDLRFKDSFTRMASTVMGNRIQSLLEDENTYTQNAVEAVLKSFHIKPKSVPDSVKSPEERMEYMLRPCGIMHRRVNLTKGWYKDAFGPMIAIRKDNGRAVALIQDELSGYRFYDTKKGSYRSVDHRTEGLFESEALCFYRPLPLKPMTLIDLMIYILHTVSPADQARVMVSTFIVVLVGVIMPRFQNTLMTTVIPSGNERVILAAGVFMVAYSFSSTMLSSVKMLLLDKIMAKTNFNVSAAVMMRVLSLPANFFREHGTGELAQRVNYVSTLTQTIMNIVYTTGLTSLMSLVYIIQIHNFAPSLMVPAIVIICITVLLNVVLSLLSMTVTRERMQASAENSSLVYALISGVQKIKLSGAEKRAFARWGNKYSKEAALQYNLPWYLRISSTITSAVGLIGVVVLYSIAIKTGVSAEDYFSFNTAYAMVLGSFNSLAAIVRSVSQVAVILKMAEPLLVTAPEVSEDKRAVTRLSGRIELSHVSFRYEPDTPLIVKDMSITIKPGEYIALVGKTGCGKSTLMRLLLGFESPEKGSIFFDKMDIKKLDERSLRQKIGVVMQNSKLIMGSIYENVAISCPGLSMEDAWDACEKAGIADDIRQMPMGMNTVITEGGGGISGGQRQRLMIARAIAGKPRILMFDEATSALDNTTQKLVTESLDALKCTRLVIAHRLSTIRACDRILVLDGGVITEEGTYDELIERKGYFSDLVERQRLDVKSA